MRSLFLLPLLAAAPVGAADWSLAPVAGYQLLTHTSDGISHGPLNEEIFLGRSVVGGLGLDAAFGGHHLRLEAQVGPYDDDFDRYCIERLTPSGRFCDEQQLRDTRFAVLAGADYTFAPRGGGVSPVIGFGAGLKRYALENERAASLARTGLFLSGIAGLEIPARAPVRIEARLLYLPEHPFLEGAPDDAKTELLVSVSVRIPLSGR